MATKIQWTDETRNFANGCTRTSPGCDHCYIERTMPMRIGGHRFDGAGVGATTGVQLFPERLVKLGAGGPIRLLDGATRPRRIFVNSMSDMFHADVPVALVAEAFAHMIANPQHSYQLLTKRHLRMRRVLSTELFWATVSKHLARLWKLDTPPAPLRAVPPWIWVGVSVEDQTRAAQRIPALEATPAHTRWLSCEPLLDEVDLSPWLGEGAAHSVPDQGIDMQEPITARSINWVVVGGESGPGARPMRPGWAVRLRDQCSDAGVPFFFKQAGAVLAQLWGCRSRTGDDPAEWPESFPRQHPVDRSGAALVGATR